MKYEFKTVMAIDPGKSNGGLAVVRNGIITLHKLPETITELVTLFNKYKSDIEKDICFIEKVGLRASDMSNPGRAIGLQKLTLHTRSVKDALEICGFIIIEVHPRTWQKGIHLHYPKGIDYHERKEINKHYAIEMFKELKVYKWNADALCILFFAFIKIRHDSDYMHNNLPISETLL